jgi:two-component system response regulator
MSNYALLVEDNRDDQLFILSVFKDLGIGGTQCVSDGDAALTFLKNNPPPAAIFLDLSMPKLSGHEVLKKIRTDKDFQAIRHVPVIVVSSAKEISDIETAYTLGCNSYVYKPIGYNEFREAISQVVSYWLKRNIVPLFTSATRSQAEPSSSQQTPAKSGGDT